MKVLLLGDATDPSWSTRAINVMQGLRAQHTFLDPDSTVFLEGTEEITWHTFAGGAANMLLAKLIEQQLGPRCVGRNTSITLKDDSAKSLAAVRQHLRSLLDQERPTQADANRFVDTTANAHVSKFEQCLPERLLQELVATALYDLTGARAALAAATVPLIRKN